jgi:hypothetical protein
MSLSQEEGLLGARLRTEAVWKLGHGFSLEPALRVYYRYTGDGSNLSPIETLPGLEGEAEFAPKGHARGMGTQWRNAWKKPAIAGGEMGMALTGQGAAEWGTPRFENAGDAMNSNGNIGQEGIADGNSGNESEIWLGYPVRTGVMGSSRHSLWQAGALWEAGWKKTQAKSGHEQVLQITVRWREFFGEESHALEWDPAVWSGGLLARVCLFDDLELEARWNLVGEKFYRGFGETLRIQPHSETHFGARHSLGKRVSVSVALLNAFGEELQEHPLGNPYRFRVMAGAQGRW